MLYRHIFTSPARRRTSVVHPLVLLLAVLFNHPPSSGAAVGISGNCSQALGLEDGRIQDGQLTASSSYEPNLVGPANARLNTERGGGAWCPRSQIEKSKENEEYLEIDLVQDHVISAILTQGRFANGLGQEFAEHFSLEFRSKSQNQFVKYTDPAGGSVLRGNTDTFQVTQYNLTRIVVASRVRIVPLSIYPRTVCMRVELKGCLYPGNFFSVLTREKVVEEVENLYLESRVEEGEWNETVYLGIAIGVLVTVVLASTAAIGLVLYRSRVQEMKPSISRYNFISAESNSSLQNPTLQSSSDSSIVLNTSLQSSVLRESLDNRLLSRSVLRESLDNRLLSRSGLRESLDNGLLGRSVLRDSLDNRLLSRSVLKTRSSYQGRRGQRRRAGTDLPGEGGIAVIHKPGLNPISGSHNNPLYSRRLELKYLRDVLVHGSRGSSLSLEIPNPGPGSTGRSNQGTGSSGENYRRRSDNPVAGPGTSVRSTADRARNPRTGPGSGAGPNTANRTPGPRGEGRTSEPDGQAVTPPPALPARKTNFTAQALNRIYAGDVIRYLPEKRIQRSTPYNLS